MGRRNDQRRDRDSQERTVVRLVEPEVPRAWWVTPLKVCGVMLLCLLTALLTRVLFPTTNVVQIPTPILPSQAMKRLGIPAKYHGFTLVDTAGPGSSIAHNTSCPNCGFAGAVVTITWPEAPGPGWRKYDTDESGEYAQAYDDHRRLARLMED